MLLHESCRSSSGARPSHGRHRRVSLLSCSCRAILQVETACVLQNEAKELLRVRNYVNNVLSVATGQPVEKIQHDFNRNK